MSLMRAVLSPMAGVARLSLFDRTGLNRFDATPHGFWQSWAALPFAAGPYLVGVQGLGRLAAAAGQKPLDLPTTLAIFITAWLTYAVLFVGLAGLLHRQRSALPTLMVLNWFSLFQLLLAMPLLLLGGYGVLGESLFSLLYWGLICYLFSVKLYVLRVALGATFVQALGLVVVDILVDILVRMAFIRLMY